MYKQHFGLTETPFSISPDPRYLFMSARHREALAHLLYGLRIDGGFVLLTGEVGTGKTTLCRCLLEQVPENCDIAFIFNPKVNVLELLRTLCDELHIELPANLRGLKALVDRLNAHLLASHARGRKTVLIVDEAQNLSNDVLELLRLLTNLETSQRKLLQIILLGQPELRERLAQPQMRQLAQRIVARYHLEPLSSQEVSTYVQHRLAVAGARAALFPPRVLQRLYHLSGGTPRLINLICDRALLGAYVRGRQAVDSATLKRAAREVLGEPGGRPPARLPPTLTTALAVAVLAGLAVAIQHGLPVPQLPRPAPPVQIEQRSEATAPVAADRPAPPLAVVPAADREPAPTEQETPPLAASDSAPAPAAAEPLASSGPAADTAEPAPPAERQPASSESSPGIIAAPGREEHWLHEAMAVRSLFAQWQIEVAEPTALEDACRRAGQVDLHCLPMNDGLASLRSFNSPAIVELRQADGPDFLATLLELGPEQVRLAVAGKIQEVPLDSLMRQWTGRYTLLWRAPEGWGRGLGIGARDPAVAWIDQRLARWEGAPPRGSAGNLFTEELARRVRDFQRAHGLKADGLVGRMTLARLAALTDAEAPVLAQQDH